MGFPGGSESAFNAGDLGLIPWLGRSPLRGEWQPTTVFLPGDFHGQRSLVGYSPWVCKESDMMVWLTLLVESNYELYELIRYGYLDENWDALSVEEEIGCWTSKSSKWLLSDSTWNLPFQANPRKLQKSFMIIPISITLSINLSTRKSIFS